MDKSSEFNICFAVILDSSEHPCVITGLPRLPKMSGISPFSSLEMPKISGKTLKIVQLSGKVWNKKDNFVKNLKIDTLCLHNQSLIPFFKRNGI